MNRKSNPLRKVARHLRKPPSPRDGMPKNSAYKIGTIPLILPKEHPLPKYQTKFPLYDRYFLGFFRDFGEQTPDWVLIDIGANVGDTALSILSVSPKALIISVEGSPHFLEYLKLNTRNFPGVTVLEAFVTHEKGDWSYIRNNGTGHLIKGKEGMPIDTPQISPAEVLSLATGKPRVWKSDTDGYDIPILLSHFSEIVESCEIIWIEFDPIGNFGDSSDIDELLKKFTELHHDVVLFDNFGHRFARFPARQAVEFLPNLINWLYLQKSNNCQRVYYFDLWLLPPKLADLLCADTSVAKAK